MSAGDPPHYPPNLDAPDIELAANSAHRRGVARLVAGLLAFASTYAVLLAGCVAAPLALVRLAWADPGWWLLAGPAIAVFGSMVFVLLRGLGRRRSLGATAIEVHASEQPRLFAFLERLAADSHAPMPDRVSLSSGVNAAMLRSTSAAGLLFGGRRELVIGLGLVNVVDVHQFKAVLAHEFGHFAQSSAHVGKWAHATTVVLREIVLGRDQHDERLVRARASTSSLVRGLAWSTSLGVRGIRELLGGVLARVTRSNLALARELEFNADLHAVALCGSDAIVAALWAAQRGSLALDSSVAALRELAKHGRFSDDLYAHQRARWDSFEARTRDLDDPMVVALREPYRPGPALHFPAGEAPTEIMAYSHPSYAEREANAKRRYVADANDGKTHTGWDSAWVLFDEVSELRRRATAGAYEQLGFAAAHDASLMRSAAAIERDIVEEAAERAHDHQYFGFYANRVIGLEDIDAWIAEAERAELAALDQAFEPWRGPALERFMARWREATSNAALEQLRQDAWAGDRAVFCWVWRRASAAERVELDQRARFLDFVQAAIVGLNRHRAEVVPLLGRPEAIHRLDQALAELHRDLDQTLAAAEATPLPELRNLVAGDSTRSFLLADPLVGAREPGQALGPWLAAFMPQVATVHERLRTLHAKNLGRWLALHERVEAAVKPN